MIFLPFFPCKSWIGLEKIVVYRYSWSLHATIETCILSQVNAAINFLGRLLDHDDNVVRVLCVTAFATALNDEIKLNDFIMAKLCRAFSVHMIDDPSYALLLKHLKWFSEVWESFKRSEISLIFLNRTKNKQI